jgi:magnesium chelatase family protein
MGTEELRRHGKLDVAAAELLMEGHRDLGLSGRGWDRVIRVARTLADLDGAAGVGEPQVAAALNMRRRVEV